VRQGDEPGHWVGQVCTQNKEGVEFMVSQRLIEIGLGHAVKD